MKLVISLLFIISTKVLGCGGGGPISIDGQTPEAKLLNDPVFMNLPSDIGDKGEIVALLDISKDGQLEKIKIVSITPNSLPKEPILFALKKGKFSPNILDRKATNIKNFKFTWEFELVKVESIKLKPPQVSVAN